VTRAAEALQALMSGLRGAPLNATDWTAVIELANRTWLTPALYCALADSHGLDDLPKDVRDYLAFIHARNRDRNLRLRDQLLESVAALNRDRINPILLKGAVSLFTSPYAKIGARLMSDIDIGVQASEFQRARFRLAGLGYDDIDGDRAMGRPDDAAVLELRPYALELPARPDLPPSLHPRLVARGTARAWVPSPTSRALHVIRHDMLKEGDYWRGRIDLRHLHDLAQLARAKKGVDWKYLRASLSRNPGRNALETQLLTLQKLFGIDIPPLESRRSMARLQNWRRLMVARHPVAGMPLRLAGNLVWGCIRMLAADGLNWRDASDLAWRTTRILTGTNTGPKI